MQNPAISVLMSVYNGEKYLNTAIESILKQTFPNFEFIIIDDGSNDQSANIIRSFHDPRIVLIQQANKGLAAALNTGIGIAKGKYIIRADADDIALPDRFLKQFDFMETNPQFVAVGSWLNWIDIDGEYLCTYKWRPEPDELKRGLPFKMPVPHPGSIYRKDAIVEIGGYKNVGKLFFMEDLLLMIDLAKKGEFTNIQEPLTKLRIGLFTNSRKGKRYFRYHMKIVEKYYYDNNLDIANISNIEKSWYKCSDGQRWADYYLEIGRIYLTRNFNKKKAIKMLKLSLKNYPLSIITWFNLFLAFLPEKLIRKWKERKDRIN